MDNNLPNNGTPSFVFHVIEILPDKQDLHLVNKIVAVEDQIAHLCNSFVPGSARLDNFTHKVTHLDIAELNRVEFGSVLQAAVGFYGDPATMVNLFEKEQLVPLETLESMKANLLKPGLYASLCMRGKAAFLFYWDHRPKMDTADRKDAACNFVRYLVELCQTVYICIQGSNVEQVLTSLLKTLGITSADPMVISSAIFSNPSAMSDPTESRTKTWQLSTRNESEDDIQLRPGFTVTLPRAQHETMMCSQGRHRLAIVTRTRNRRKGVATEDTKTDSWDKMKNWLESSVFSCHTVDCDALPREDFLLLLEILGFTQEQDKFRAAQEQQSELRQKRRLLQTIQNRFLAGSSQSLQRSSSKLIYKLKRIFRERQGFTLKSLAAPIGMFGVHDKQPINTRVKVTYSQQSHQEETITWDLTEMVPEKSQIDKIERDSSSTAVVFPQFANHLVVKNLITLDPTIEKLSKVALMKSGEVLLFVESTPDSPRSYLHIHRLSQNIGMESGYGGNRIAEFYRGFDRVSLDEHTRFMALYNKNSSTIKLYRFDQSFRNCDDLGVNVDLRQYIGDHTILWMEFIPGKRELILLDDQQRLRVYEISASMMKPKHIVLPIHSHFLAACVTPDSSCLIVFSRSPQHEDDGHKRVHLEACSTSEVIDKGRLSRNNDHEHTVVRYNAKGYEHLEIQGKFSKVTLFAHVYVLGDSMSLLKNFCFDSIPVGSSAEDLQIVCRYFGPQLHLVFSTSSCNGGGERFVLNYSYVLKITTSQEIIDIKVVEDKDHQSDTPDGQSASIPELDYIYHIFDKFATSAALCSATHNVQLCALLGTSTQRNEFFLKDYVLSALERLKKQKGKSFTTFQVHVSAACIDDENWKGALLQPTDVNDCNNRLSVSSSSLKIGDWIRKLLCLVPLQVARAENNTLKPMLNGLQIPPDATYTDAVSLASLLRFGLYDFVLSSWKGNVKVVSSMGKQSSGKSYLLNHLSGSLLDVSGRRCTDGVWMTIRCEPDCLYVLLDFEGLGSFERSDQEDMLLSILSAAISNVTIFNKKDFQLEKETETIFQQFQDGVSLVKADEKLFKGIFLMAIKDVDISDVKDLKTEFFSKIRHICNKSADSFLTTLYCGEFGINALPPFQKPDFTNSVMEIGKTIRIKETQYHNGWQFMEDFKLVISQISARDWSSVDSKRLEMRISLLRKHLMSAIMLGKGVDDEKLVNFNTQEEVKDNPISIENFTVKLEDTGLQLAEDDEKGIGDVLRPLREAFELVIKRQQGNDEVWHGTYEKFLLSLVERRNARVVEWLELNTRDFDGGDIQMLMLEAKSNLAEISRKFVLCSYKCDSCFLRCILEKGHASRHSCLGNHSCMHPCNFCTSLGDSVVFGCGDKAGHNGSHNCNKKKHTCKQVCAFYPMSSNCNKVCAKTVDHDGNHHCNTQNHLCSNTCSLPGCNNPCSLPSEQNDHEIHACKEKFCPKKCSMKGCSRMCSSENHFHDLDTGSEHLCGNEHPCPIKCEAPGVCLVQTELVKQTRLFRGSRSEFEYEYISEQIEDRKPCCLMIPPNQKSHPGSHVHSTKPYVVHYCDKRCPACDYYCQLPFGHNGLHKTVHGNMKNMRFVSEQEEIDISDRKYVRGESGEAEMCMMHCKARGRGHTHLVPCPAKDGSGGCCTKDMFDGAKHLSSTSTSFGTDNAIVEMDEMTHEDYWKFLRFVDPCNKEEMELFSLCGHYCMSEKHESSLNNRSYCTEKLWHDPVQRRYPRSGSSRWNDGYVSKDGHHFTCNHSKQVPHNVIFVIDRSSSMRKQDVKPSMPKFLKRHNNRLGCVYEAILRFIRMRHNQIAHSNVGKDTVSVVLFENTASAPVKLQEMSEDVVDILVDYSAADGWFESTAKSVGKALVNTMFTATQAYVQSNDEDNTLKAVIDTASSAANNPWTGSTNYTSGLSMAWEILKESRDYHLELFEKSPVIVFLSDGDNNSGNDPVAEVKRMKQMESQLRVHTVMFGGDPKTDLLKEMAKFGEGSFHDSLNDVQLAKTFEGLAQSIEPLKVGFTKLKEGL